MKKKKDKNYFKKKCSKEKDQGLQSNLLMNRQKNIKKNLKIFKK
jgi:hypothetical protein